MFIWLFAHINSGWRTEKLVVINSHRTEMKFMGTCFVDSLFPSTGLLSLVEKHSEVSSGEPPGLWSSFSSCGPQTNALHRSVYAAPAQRVQHKGKPISVSTQDDSKSQIKHVKIMHVFTFRIYTEDLTREFVVDYRCLQRVWQRPCHPSATSLHHQRIIELLL